MCAGTETLEDEAAIVARRMDEAGVYVQFDTYEGMPHCFGMIFMKSSMGMDCMQRCVKFILDAVDAGLLGQEESGRRRGKATMALALKNPVMRREIEWSELKKELTDGEVESLLKAKRERYMKREEEMVKEWREKEEGRSLERNGENVTQNREKAELEQQQQQRQGRSQDQRGSGPATPKL